MKRALLIVLLLLSSPVAVFAQGGAICIFADPAGTDCQLVDNTPGLIQYYVVHTLSPGATAAEFAAPIPACMVGATWLNDTSVHLVTLGDSQSGVSIGFGGCIPTPNHLLTMNFSASGSTKGM